MPTARAVHEPSRARTNVRRQRLSGLPADEVRQLLCPGAVPGAEHGGTAPEHGGTAQSAGLERRPVRNTAPGSGAAPDASHDAHRQQHPPRPGPARVIRSESESKTVRVAVLERRPARVVTLSTGTPGPARVIRSTARVIGTESYVIQSES